MLNHITHEVNTMEFKQPEEDFYNWQLLEQLSEGDEITPEEEGFMYGYLTAS